MPYDKESDIYYAMLNDLKACADGLKTVSYTHLDVSKRQHVRGGLLYTCPKSNRRYKMGQNRCGYYCRKHCNSGCLPKGKSSVRKSGRGKYRILLLHFRLFLPL